MTASHDAMLPFLVDLEAPYVADAVRPYDPVDLVGYAIAFPGADYWPALGLDWLEQGVDVAPLRDRLKALEDDRARGQALRHRARRLLTTPTT